MHVHVNQLMGSYDLCKNAHIYSPGPMDTHYCTLSRDRAGVCVPKACTAQDLMNPAAAMPILNLGMQSIAQVGVCVWMWMRQNQSSRTSWRDSDAPTSVLWH